MYISRQRKKNDVDQFVSRAEQPAGRKRGDGRQIDLRHVSATSTR
jgi:hypothetical protein